MMSTTKRHMAMRTNTMSIVVSSLDPAMLFVSRRLTLRHGEVVSRVIWS